jgi:recombination directionality factor gp3-like protein
MAIIDLQRRIVESGRIRIGQKVATASGGSRPDKLDTFRLTSADKRRIEQAAEAYGGEVSQWVAPAGKQWQVITTRDWLDVIVPPSDLSFSQSYELWSAGGCQRRCDGEIEQLSDGPCLCDPAKRECDIHTRLSVMLRDLPGLGVWRIDTQGYYAATELAGAVQVIQVAAGRGALLPARLRLEQRSVKRPGADGKPQTLRFAVPVLDIEVSPAQLLAGSLTPLALVDTPAALTPVPQLPGAPTPSIAEQSAPPTPRPRRRNAAPDIPSSGRTRRSTEQPGQEGAGSPPAATPPVPVSTDQPEPEPSDGADTPPAGEEPSAGPGTVQPAAASPNDVCDHPTDLRVGTRAGVVCSQCGEKLAAADGPGEGYPPARQSKTPEDDGYWPSRVHAVASEHGIDHDGLRLIGAALKRIPADGIADWSMSSLADAEWEGLDKLMRRLPASLDVDAATLWIWPIAESRGLADWDAIDPLVTAAYGRQPDDVGVAEWVAFGLRLHAGEYDPAQPSARPRTA